MIGSIDFFQIVAQSRPNDRKLSDRGVRRGTCMVGGKAAAEAGAVTHGAVRCSVWLGDFDDARNVTDLISRVCRLGRARVADWTAPCVNGLRGVVDGRVRTEQ